MDAYLKLDTEMASVTAEELKRLGKEVFESDSIIATRVPVAEEQADKTNRKE